MTQVNDSAPATAPEVLELTESLLNLRLTTRQAIFLVSAVRARQDPSLDPPVEQKPPATPSATSPAAAAVVVPAPVVASAVASPAPAAANQIIILGAGDVYHLPGDHEIGPFYLVTRGKEPGVYSGWDNAGAQVTGVPTSLARGVPSVAAGVRRMHDAIREGRAARIVV